MPYSLEEFRKAYNEVLTARFGMRHADQVVAQRYRQYLKMSRFVGEEGEITAERDDTGIVHVRFRPKLAA